VFLGPRFERADIEQVFRPGTARFADYAGREVDLLDDVARRLAGGDVVGWFQGRMEFGPRALGNRSILADPRDPAMRERVNALVKKREGFRPFAPAVLAHRAGEHFEVDHDMPFMLETCQVRSPVDLPAITHVDGSARVQTVDPATNPRFHRLLEAFESQTGCPVLLNTSLNLRGEPIVCTPVDALVCFIRSGLDVLVLEDVVIERAGLPDAWMAAVGADRREHSGVAHSVYTLL